MNNTFELIPASIVRTKSKKNNKTIILAVDRVPETHKYSHGMTKDAVVIEYSSGAEIIDRTVPF